MTNIIILLFSIVFLVFSIKHQKKAFLLLVFLLPSYLIRFSILSIPATMLEVMILILFSTWFYRNISNLTDNIKSKIKGGGENIRKYPFGFEIGLWIFLAFMAVWVANFSNSAFGIWKAYFFEPVLLFLLTFNIFVAAKESKRKFVQEVIMALSLSALVLSIYAIFQKFTGFGIANPYWAEATTRRVTSVFLYPNALGLFLAPIVIMSVGLLKSICAKEKKEKYFLHKVVVLSISIFSSVLAILFAKSEGALVALLVALTLFLTAIILSNFNKLKLVILSNIVLIVVFVFLSPLFFLRVVPEHSFPDYGSNVANKVYDKITLKDFSGEVRKQQWRETFEMMGDMNRWFWGTGFSMYRDSVKEYHQEGIFFNSERDVDFRSKIVHFDEEYKKKFWFPVEIYMYPHNLLLNFWTEMGLFAVFLFAWIVLKFFNIGIKLLNDENKYLVMGVVFAMLVIVVHGIVDVPYFKNDLAVIFWLIVGMLGILSLKNDKVKSEK